MANKKNNRLGRGLLAALVITVAGVGYWSTSADQNEAPKLSQVQTAKPKASKRLQKLAPLVQAASERKVKAESPEPSDNQATEEEVARVQEAIDRMREVRAQISREDIIEEQERYKQALQAAQAVVPREPTEVKTVHEDGMDWEVLTYDNGETRYRLANINS